jgi:hypothetical protein
MDLLVGLIGTTNRVAEPEAAGTLLACNDRGQMAQRIVEMVSADVLIVVVALTVSSVMVARPRFL